jgi:hypothetical protein
LHFFFSSSAHRHVEYLVGSLAGEWTEVELVVAPIAPDAVAEVHSLPITQFVVRVNGRLGEHFGQVVQSVIIDMADQWRCYF